jgi:hypothetical protein
MVDAKNSELRFAAGLSSDTLRARALHRRETAARLWDDRLERLLLEEADELERRASALELEGAIDAKEANAAGETVQPDVAALRENMKTR